MVGPRLFALLAILALAMRVAVPAGWMPTTDLGLAVCTGEGMVAAPTAWAEDWAKRLGKPAPQKTTTTDHPCAFASAGTALAEPFPAPAPVLLAATEAPAPARPRALTPGRGLAAPPPPPTGPPAHL